MSLPYDDARCADRYCEQGMSLRDYFAAKAMNGLLAQSMGTALGSDPKHAAEYAYAIADAMMAVNAAYALCGPYRREDSCDIKPPRDVTPPTGELDTLRELIGLAYGHLWMVNNEPGTPNRYSPEQAAYEARKLLRDTMTQEQRGAFINRVIAQRRTPPTEGAK